MDNGRKLSDMLAKYRPGDKIVLQIIRKGKRIELPVTLGKPSDSTGEYGGGDAFLGVRPHDDNDDRSLGVRINTVRNGSALRLGLDDGDIITHINGYPLVDWSDLSTAINNMEPGETIDLTYLRNGVEQKASGAIGRENDPALSDSRGFLGIYAGEMNPTKAQLLGFQHPYGSYIKRVIPGSAAEKAGLQPLDYIIAIEQFEMSSNRSLTNALAKFSPGNEVTVTFIREGEQMTTRAVLGEESDDDYTQPCEELPFFGVSDNGCVSRKGVAVNIVRGSAAEAAGLVSGDVITTFNQKTIIDWGDLSGAINGTQPGQQIAIVFNRNGQTQEATAIMGNECDESGQNRNENHWYDYNYDSSFGDRPRREADETYTVDMDKIQVQLSDISQEEEAAMASRGVAVATKGDLAVNNLQVFTNPNKGMFRLEFTLPATGETSVSVYNSQGRVLYSFELGTFSGPFSDDIDLSQNGPGDYYLFVQQGSSSMGQKVSLVY
ncbi:MAG: PDZ domain-containing protein [Saprospiraceae bacterium]